MQHRAVPSFAPPTCSSCRGFLALYAPSLIPLTAVIANRCRGDPRGLADLSVLMLTAPAVPGADRTGVRGVRCVMMLNYR